MVAICACGAFWQILDRSTPPPVSSRDEHWQQCVVRRLNTLVLSCGLIASQSGDRLTWHVVLGMQQCKAGGSQEMQQPAVCMLHGATKARFRLHCNISARDACAEHALRKHQLILPGKCVKSPARARRALAMEDKRHDMRLLLHSYAGRS